MRLSFSSGVDDRRYRLSISSMKTLAVALVVSILVLTALSLARFELSDITFLKPLKLESFFDMLGRSSLASWVSSLIGISAAWVWVNSAQETLDRHLRRLFWVLAVCSLLLGINLQAKFFGEFYDSTLVERWHLSLQPYVTIAFGLLLIAAIAAGWRISTRVNRTAFVVYLGSCMFVLVGYWLPTLELGHVTGLTIVTRLLQMLGASGLLIAALLCLNPSPPAERFGLTRNLTVKLLLIALFFLLVSIGMRVLEALGHTSDPYHLRHLLDIRLEGNLPTVFSYAILLFSAFLAWRIAHVPQEPQRRHWIGLSMIFVYLSLDEAATLHERLVPLIRQFAPKLDAETSGLLRFGWIIPFAVFVVLFVMAYAPFLRRLPSRTRWGLILSGAVYVMGAMGFEIMEGYATEHYGTVVRAWLETFEEFIEMLGVILFIYFLIRYLNHIRRPMSSAEALK